MERRKEGPLRVSTALAYHLEGNLGLDLFGSSFCSVKDFVGTVKAFVLSVLLLLFVTSHYDGFLSQKLIEAHRNSLKDPANLYETGIPEFSPSLNLRTAATVYKNTEEDAARATFQGPTMDDFDTKLMLARKLACTTATPDGVSDPKSDETTFLAGINKLQSQIHLIRSQYRRRFNVIRSSTASLPNEILILIFRLVCSATEKGKGPGCPPIILGSVSSHWREVVTDMPEFWKTFSVRTSNENLQSTVPLLQVYSERRRQMPGSIQLDLEGLDFNSLQVLESLEILERSLLSGDASNLLQAMKVHCPPPHWLFTIAKNCSNLHELTLSWTPQNTKMFIWPRKFPTYPLLPNLRILRINRVPIMLCFDLLLGCPNLIEFTCTTPLIHVRIDPDGWMMRAPYQVVTFPHLKRLAWTPTTKYWDKYFLQFFRFPSLRHFSWPIWPGQHSQELFNSFVTALPPSLETLEIIISPGPLIALRRIKRIFEQLRGITQLILTDVPPLAHSSFLQMLQNPTLLPSLKVFRCIQKDSEKGEIRERESWAYHLHEMLQQRKLQGVKSFRYELINAEILWRAEDKELISSLERDGGFKVEILCNGLALKL